MEEACKNCRFYLADNNPVFRSEGHCRRYPPAAAMPHFPPISDKQWCGEWRASHNYLDEMISLHKAIMRPTQPDNSEAIVEIARKAGAAYDAMSPEEKAAHDQAQRESFARANISTGDPRFD